MYKLGPPRIPYPQNTGTHTTKAALCGAFTHGVGFSVPDLRLIDAYMIAAIDFQGIGIAAEINGVAPATRCLAANGTITKVKRIGMGRT
jgi:hypothetical protein